MSAVDAILWRPVEFDPAMPVVRRGEGNPAVADHACKAAAIPAVVSRRELDPMALGVCRYCGRLL